MSRKKKIITLVFLLIFTIGTWIAIQSTNFSALNAENSLLLERENFSPSLVANNLEGSLNQKFTYEIQIPEQSLSNLGSEDYRLLIYRLADNALIVRFNGNVIGSFGDMEGGQSNNWNGLISYRIDNALIQVSNVLSIETFAVYRTGLSTTPIYILPESNKMRKILGHLELFGEKLITTSIGFIIFAAVFSLILFQISRGNGNLFLNMSLATILIGIYFMDYLSFESIDLSYLIYKKITMGSLFISLGLYSMVISYYFKNSFLKIIGLITIVGTLLMVVISADMIVFKNLYTYWYFIGLLNVAIWVTISFKNMKHNSTAYVFFLGFTVIGIYATLAVVLDVINSYFTINSPVIYIATFAAIPIALAYENMNEQAISLALEKTLREKEFLNSVTDELTGLWNQRYFYTMQSSDFSNYTMAIVDLDDFKSVNDAYGHLTGDEVLKDIATTIKALLRKTDVVCRYGGDEFIILLKDCDMTEAYEVMEEIRSAVEEKTTIYKGNHIQVTISIGMMSSQEDDDMNHVFGLVDEQLYRAKLQGKNSIAYIDAVNE